MLAEKNAFIVCTDHQQGYTFQVNLQKLGWSGQIIPDSATFLSQAKQHPNVGFAIMADQLESNVRGMDLLRHAHETGLCLPMIMIAPFSDLDFISEASKLGAAAILLRPISRSMIKDSVARAAEFRPVLEHQKQIRHYAAQLSRLNEREQKILRMAVDGWTNKKIAGNLDVYVKTIERSRKSAYEKLNVRSAAEMARAFTLGGLQNLQPTVSVFGPPPLQASPMLSANPPILPPHFAQ